MEILVESGHRARTTTCSAAIPAAKSPSEAGCSRLMRKAGYEPHVYVSTNLTYAKARDPLLGPERSCSTSSSPHRTRAKIPRTARRLVLRCVFRRTRTLIPALPDRRFRAPDQPRGSERSDEGGLGGSVLGWLESLLLPHRGPVKLDQVRVVQHAIADGIGDRRIVERFMPSFRRHLRGDDRGCA